MNSIPIEFKVMELLKVIANDYQFDKSDKYYCGFVNCDVDGFDDPDKREAYVDLINRPNYYSCMFNMFNLTTENGVDIHETIFIKIN